MKLSLSILFVFIASTSCFAQAVAPPAVAPVFNATANDEVAKQLIESVDHVVGKNIPESLQVRHLNLVAGKIAAVGGANASAHKTGFAKKLARIAKDRNVAIKLRTEAVNHLKTLINPRNLSDTLQKKIFHSLLKLVIDPAVDPRVKDAAITAMSK